MSAAGGWRASGTRATASGARTGSQRARGLLDKTVSISKVRGEPHVLEDGSELSITAHPSYLLRFTDEAQKDQERLPPICQP